MAKKRKATQKHDVDQSEIRCWESRRWVLHYERIVDRGIEATMDAWKMTLPHGELGETRTVIDICSELLVEAKYLECIMAPQILRACAKRLQDVARNITKKADV